MHKSVFVVVMISLLVGCSPGSAKKAKVVAGDMTANEICSVMGYLIRKKLGSNVKTINMPCRVISSDGRNVEMSSAYKPPIGSNKIKYFAKGYGTGGKFRLDKIMAVGIDDDYVSFSSW
jgi:hypothetical protein